MAAGKNTYIWLLVRRRYLRGHMEFCMEADHKHIYEYYTELPVYSNNYRH